MTFMRWLFVLAIVLSLSPAHAATLFTENFEVTRGDIDTGTATTNALTAKGWGPFGFNIDNISRTPTLSVAACPSEFGAGAGSCLRAQYVDYVCPVTDTVACEAGPKGEARMDYFFAATVDIWRTYKMVDKFVDANKAMQHNGKRHYFNHATLPDTFIGFGDASSDNVYFAMNQSITPGTHASGVYIGLNANTLYCIEEHLGNGIYELYVNNVFRGSTTNWQSPSSGWSEFRLYRQGGGNLYRWEDDITVSTTRTSACGGSTPPPPDTTAPSIPTGVTIQ